MPIEASYTGPDAVLLGDVDRPDEIGVQLVTARPANEARLAAPVVPRRVAAAGAPLARVPRIDPDDETAGRLGLVDQEGAQLGERPGVQTPPRRPPALLGARADVGQVL